MNKKEKYKIDKFLWKNNFFPWKMKLFILRIAILFLIIRNVKMADLSFYHTTDEIALKLDKLISSNKCQNFSIEKHGSNEYKLENPTIPLFFYDIKPKKPAEYQKKIFIIGGQHARELISTEFLFHFVHYCLILLKLSLVPFLKTYFLYLSSLVSSNYFY